MVCELTAIDRHFAAFIKHDAGDSPWWLELIVSLASSAVGQGNVCLNLADVAGMTVVMDGSDYQLPELDLLLAQLPGIAAVGTPGEFKPLVLDGNGRLYLYRYWQYERDMALVLLEKAEAPVVDLDEGVLGIGVRRLFPAPAVAGIDWQKIAALAAVRKKFCVISGGPGTGKTSTVVKILALLIEQAAGKSLRIALAAPTGKAAARLKESIRLMKDSLDCSAAVKTLIPENVTTIHRLLGVRSGSVRFRHTEDNILPHDVVIIDEASMVALPLMAKLVKAINGSARLILLGDRDQLASVEAGAVLGDICGSGRQDSYSTGFADFIKRVAADIIPADPVVIASPVLSDSLVVLKQNYRFGADSSIGKLSQAINSGDGMKAFTFLNDERSLNSCWQDVPGSDRLKKALEKKIISGYAPFLTAASPAEALKLFDRFRVLSAMRQGPYGVVGLNAIVEEILAENGLIKHNNRWYSGRPVMVTVNDYSMKLFNGDIGIVFPDPDYGGDPRVWFPAPEGGVRSVSPLRLPLHETVYAMTVHKSQGSEFENILMILPDHDSGTLARELIYTGITRAKNGVEVWADKNVFIAAVARRTDRKAGLADILWCDVKC